MTEKQAKKELMRRAVDLSPTVHVGKEGLDDGVVEEVRNQLKKKRLIKVKALPSTEGDAESVAVFLAESTGAVVVDVRGSIIILTDSRTWTSLSQKKL